MGKNFCKIEDKWCKYCKHQKCFFEQEILLKHVHRCPKRESSRTVRLKDYIASADFDSVMEEMFRWWPDQEKNICGYREVWEKLKNMRADKTDWFIRVVEVHEPERETQFGHISAEDWLCTDGIDPAGKCWAIEFEPWKHWLGMNISRETLSSLNKNTILAAILFEMTWSGYSEEEVQEEHDKINKSFEDFMIEENKKKDSVN